MATGEDVSDYKKIIERIREILDKQFEGGLPPMGSESIDARNEASNEPHTRGEDEASEPKKDESNEVSNEQPTKKGIAKIATGAGLGIGTGLGVTSNLTKSKEKNATPSFLIFLIFFIITLFFYFIDLFYLHFGGLDFRVFFDLIKSGNLLMLLRILFPIYSLVIFLILLLFLSIEEHKLAYYLVVVFVSLLVANILSTRLSLGYTLFSMSLPVIALLVSMFIVASKLENNTLFFSWVLLIVTVSTILSMGGTDFASVLHLVIAMMIWLFLVNPTNNLETSNYIISILLIIDFFFFNILRTYVPSLSLVNRFIFPVWPLFVVFYGAYKGIKSAQVLGIIIVSAYILVFLGGTYGWSSIRTQMEASPEEIDEASSFFNNLLTRIKEIPIGIKKTFIRSLDEATGGYYTGREKDTGETTTYGVYITEFEPMTKTFYQDEDVVLWGTIKAKALNKPIRLTVSCSADDVKGKITREDLSNEQGYEVYQYEEIPFDCIFEKGKLKTGVNKITLNVKFNYETSASIMTYFMDLDRMRSLRKRNIDPLKEAGITDRNPRAEYDPGPIELGIGTPSPPIGLSKDKNGFSRIGLTMKPKWIGEVIKINKLQIKLPEGIELKDNCRGDFMIENETYILKKEAIDKIELPIDTYKTWECPIIIRKENIESVLEKMAHKYEIRIDYVYQIDRSTSLIILKSKNQQNGTMNLANTTPKNLTKPTSPQTTPEPMEDTKNTSNGTSNKEPSLWPTMP